VTGRYSNQLNYQTFYFVVLNYLFFHLSFQAAEYLRQALHKPLFVVLFLKK